MNLFSLAHLSFHEATVVGFAWIGSGIELKCEGVTSSDGSKNVTVIFETVHRCFADDVERKGPLMEAPDAEILSISGGSRGVELLLEWNDFRTHTSWTRHYFIVADIIRLS